MKTKLLISSGFALFILAYALLGRHIDEVSAKLESDSLAVKHVDRPSDKEKGNVIGQPSLTVSSVELETPEMKNARIMAKARSDYAKVLPLIDAVKTGNISNIAHVHMDRIKGEYLSFFKSLGLSDELSEAVFQMLKSEMALALARPQALKQADQGSANANHLKQLTSELKASVGEENYNRIKYWQITSQERKRTQAFKSELVSKSGTLTPEKGAIVTDALYQARQGNPISILNNPHATTQEKMAYVNDVKARLAPHLDRIEMELLTAQLTQIAEKPLLRPELLKKIPKLGQ